MNRGFCNITHRRLNINWVPHGSDIIKSFVRPLVTRWAFSVISRNLSFLYIWTISSYAQHQLRPNGARMCQPLNHCVLVQWLSDRALKSVMLRRHRLLMCPIGGTWPVTIRARQPLGIWTDRLISADMICHRSSSETWIIWTADSTQ